MRLRLLAPPTHIPMGLQERFDADWLPDPNHSWNGTHCHRWCGQANGEGYGQIQVGRANGKKLINRVAWELVHRPIPEGSHRCANPRASMSITYF